MPINHTSAILTISSSNLETLVEFYRQLLGLEPEIFIPAIYAEFHLSGLKLGIFRPRSPKQSETIGETGEMGRQGHRDDANRTPNEKERTGMGLCLEVPDLEGAIAYLTRLGYPPPGEIRTASHGREIHAYDPDGNWLILHQA
jgi:catechol 2,3-dioxygenase-like lactoylglutathione lyase family enzyme